MQEGTKSAELHRLVTLPYVPPESFPWSRGHNTPDLIRTMRNDSRHQGDFPSFKDQNRHRFTHEIEYSISQNNVRPVARLRDDSSPRAWTRPRAASPAAKEPYISAASSPSPVARTSRTRRSAHPETAQAHPEHLRSGTGTAISRCVTCPTRRSRNAPGGDLGLLGSVSVPACSVSQHMRPSHRNCVSAASAIPRGRPAMAASCGPRSRPHARPGTGAAIPPRSSPRGGRRRRRRAAPSRASAASVGLDG